MTVQKLGSGSSTKFKVTVGSDKLSVSSPFRRVVQVEVPGGSSYVDWKTIRTASVTYAPSASGTYRFRSYVERVSDGTRSLVSPVLSVTK